MPHLEQPPRQLGDRLVALPRGARCHALVQARVGRHVAKAGPRRGAGRGTVLQAAIQQRQQRLEYLALEAKLWLRA